MNQAYRIIAGQKVYLEPTGKCQCQNPDYDFIVCRHCGLDNPRPRFGRYRKL